MNSTICLTTTLLVTRVVVGGWRKSLVLSIQIREPGHNYSIVRCNSVMRVKISVGLKRSYGERERSDDEKSLPRIWPSKWNL